MTEIKFCENNLTYGTEETANKLQENYPAIEVAVESCLGYCGDCSDGPFALVNDELIQADSADELYKKIEKLI
jgi:uncharacterized protein YuzB (UPF0349 family)